MFEYWAQMISIPLQEIMTQHMPGLGAPWEVKNKNSDWVMCDCDGKTHEMLQL